MEKESKKIRPKPGLNQYSNSTSNQQTLWALLENVIKCFDLEQVAVTAQMIDKKPRVFLVISN